MKETIEYLKRNRRVNDTFMKKLQKVGFEISHEKCGYWDNVECVRIGRSCIPLLETHYSDDGNSMSLDYKYQNDVIRDIYNALEREKKKAEEADELVNSFFKKLGLED